MTLGSKIRRARERKGWSQRQLGRLTGVSGAYISQVESGRVPHPSVRYIAWLATALNLSMNYLCRDLVAGKPKANR